MPSSPALAPSADTPDRQQLSITVGEGGTKAGLAIDISSTGLVAIGALVAMTLLSTAVLVRAATRRPT